MLLLLVESLSWALWSILIMGDEAWVLIRIAQSLGSLSKRRSCRKKTANNKACFVKAPQYIGTYVRIYIPKTFSANFLAVGFPPFPFKSSSRRFGCHLVSLNTLCAFRSHSLLRWWPKKNQVGPL